MSCSTGELYSLFKLPVLKDSFLRLHCGYIITRKNRVQRLLCLDPLLVLINYGEKKFIILIKITFSGIEIVIL